MKNVKGKTDVFDDAIAAAPTERRNRRSIRALQRATKKLKGKGDVLKIRLILSNAAHPRLKGKGDVLIFNQLQTTN